MYHLPSDWAGGALLVALGALFAAWGARSRGALLVAVPAIVVWMIWRSDGFSLSLPVVGFALGLLVATGAHALRYPGLATRWAVLAQAIATYVWLVLGAMEMRMIIADEEVAFYGLMSMLVLGTAFSVLGYVLTREELFAARFGDGTRLMAETALSVGALMLTGGVFVALMLTFGFDTYEVEILEIITLWPIGCVIVVTAGGIGYSVLAKTGRAPALSVGFAVALALLMPVAMAILPGATTVHAVIALAAMIAVSVAGSFTYLLSWTVLGNLGIAAVLLFLLQVTVGSLIGQSVFFLIAGLVLIAVAFVSARMIRQHGRGTGERTI